MIPSCDLSAYFEVQQAAKRVLDDLVEFIGPQSTERTIAEFAASRLADLGYAETWYYNCPAFVLLGSRSCASLSGKNYQASDECVGELNLVTVDLNPCCGPIWGDCARSFYVEMGRAVSQPSADHTTPQFSLGWSAQSHLHRAMLRFVTPETTFHQLYEFANAEVNALGFENLDASANFGHSICSELHQRVYIEAGNNARLGSVSCFTFEPHIRTKQGRWGFKHENIYHFDAEGLAWEL